MRWIRTLTDWCEACKQLHPSTKVLRLSTQTACQLGPRIIFPSVEQGPETPPRGLTSPMSMSCDLRWRRGRTYFLDSNSIPTSALSEPWLRCFAGCRRLCDALPYSWERCDAMIRTQIICRVGRVRSDPGLVIVQGRAGGP